MDLRDRIAAEPVFENYKPSDGHAPAPGRLSRLARLLGVSGREAEIRRCFQLVCGDSLEPGAGWSSLNADGVPVQFALSLPNGRRPALEFVGESFRAGMEFGERRAFGLEQMTHLAEALGLNSDLNLVRSGLEDLTVEGSPADGEDPAGAFWIGASFDPAGTASMTVYANARRGPEGSRSERLAAFTQTVAERAWGRIFAVAEAAALKPLGAGVRIAAGSRPHARIYFGAYGVTPRVFRRMFRDADAPPQFDAALAAFFDAVLESDSFPTQSVVFSFGSSGDGEWSPKLELCAHCAWPTADEAAARCGACLDQLGADAGSYREAIRIAGVPVYVGVGMRNAEPYASLYLNPGRSGL
jgi:hypothetical protein